MSHEAYEAVVAAAPALRKALDQVPQHDRPSFEAAYLIALRLADKYRPHRGYVDETIPQLREFVADAFDPRDACQALHTIGMWVVTKRGSAGHGTRREVGPMLAELGGADPSEFEDDEEPFLELGGELRGATPLRGVAPWELGGAGPELGGAERKLGGVEGELGGVNRELGGADPSTPPSSPPSSPPVLPPSSTRLAAFDDGRSVAAVTAAVPLAPLAAVMVKNEDGTPRRLADGQRMWHDEHGICVKCSWRSEGSAYCPLYETLTVDEAGNCLAARLLDSHHPKAMLS